MNYTKLDLQPNTNTELNTLIEVSSSNLNSKIIEVSDDFFSPVTDLIKPTPPVSKKGQFGPNGALYDGWESRRHNSTYDYAIIKLGCPSATIKFLDIDTTHFNGNEGQAASVYGIYKPNEDVVRINDESWFEILPVVKLGPSQQHLYKLETFSKPVTHLQLRMIPDGGIARFRAYGEINAVWPDNLDEILDLASVYVCGKVIFTSDQHFGRGDNLILPGRGKDMGDGWETKRSRVEGHKDYVIIKLGEAGYLSNVEFDTCHFKGNFPAGVKLEGLYSPNKNPSSDYNSDDWKDLLDGIVKVGPHLQHYFQITDDKNKYTHVRVTIYPDGGLKRVRINGSRERGNGFTIKTDQKSITNVSNAIDKNKEEKEYKIVPLLPLTSEAFKVFGNVIQSFEDQSSTPPWVKTKRVNLNTATKLCNVSQIENDYPVKDEAKLNFCVYKCEPIDISKGFKISMLERHKYTTQSFIPMGEGGKSYVIIVAKNDDQTNKPNLKTLRGFITTTDKAITYKKNIWHHPMIMLDKTTNFTCLVNENDTNEDCEEVPIEDNLVIKKQ